MKKITILSLHMGYGGVEKSIIKLANMLVTKYDVEIVSVYKLYDNPSFEINKNVKVKYLMEKIKPNKEELRSAFINKNIIKIIKQSFYSFKVIYFRRKKVIEYIKKCDSDVIISSRVLFTKWLSKYGRNNIIKIAQEHRHHNNDNKYINKLINYCKNIDYLMPVSKELSEFYRNKIKGKTKIKYIPHSLDNLDFETSKLDQKNIISIGRFSYEKGFLDLIEVFSLLIKDKPDWKLHIIGDGSQRNQIENKIFEKKLKENVILHGFQDSKYVNELLSKSSIYVMTSYEESFGIVLLEASAHGLPLIVFDSAQGAKEIVINGENGYLIENRDFKKMSKIIKELIDNPIKLKEMGKKSKDKSLTFSYNEIKKETLLFFEKILNRQGDNI